MGNVDITPETSTDQERDEHGRLLPGHSGNLKGRPKKGHSITEAFRSMFEAEPEVKAQVVQAIKEKALAGDMNAAKMVWEYMDGKPKQAVVGGDDEDEPLKHVMTVRIKKD